jgi:hypothetical protein
MGTKLPALYQSIFSEDVRNGLFPFRMTEKENVVISFAGPADDVRRANSVCGSIARNTWHEEENIQRAIKDIATQMSYFGEALYEIVRNPEDGAVSLFSFSPSGVWSVFGIYLQIAPRKNWPFLDGKRYAVLKHRDVWKICMPAELGGARGYRRVLDQLSTWPDLGPPFFQADMAERQISPHFKFQEYQTNIRAERYRCTRAWGWSLRDWSLNDITEYYQFRRYLTFKWAQSTLLNHIIAELNRLLVSIGLAAVVLVEGLPSPEQIIDAREKLRLGVLDFAGARRAVSHSV